MSDAYANTPLADGAVEYFAGRFIEALMPAIDVSNGDADLATLGDGSAGLSVSGDPKNLLVAAIVGIQRMFGAHAAPIFRVAANRYEISKDSEIQLMVFECADKLDDGASDEGFIEWITGYFGVKKKEPEFLEALDGYASAPYANDAEADVAFMRNRLRGAYEYLIAGAFQSMPPTEIPGQSFRFVDEQFCRLAMGAAMTMITVEDELGQGLSIQLIAEQRVRQKDIAAAKEKDPDPDVDIDLDGVGPGL